MGSKHCSWEKPTSEETKEGKLVHLVLKKVSRGYFGDTADDVFWNSAMPMKHQIYDFVLNETFYEFVFINADKFSS
jgi:hypothetical protein